MNEREEQECNTHTTWQVEIVWVCSGIGTCCTSL